MELLPVVYGSVTKRGWQDEKFTNILKTCFSSMHQVFLNVHSGFMLILCNKKIISTIFFFLQKLRLNVHESVKWCNHQKMRNIKCKLTHTNKYIILKYHTKIDLIKVISKCIFECVFAIFGGTYAENMFSK